MGRFKWCFIGTGKLDKAVARQLLAEICSQAGLNYSNLE